MAREEGIGLKTTSLDQVRSAAKSRDAWWTVVLVDPVASRLVRRAAGHSWITPNRLTWLALLVGLCAAAAFAQAGRWWLVAGALAYHVSFVIDCMDGKLARLTRTGSIFGHWLDFMFDRLLVVVCAIALLGGQYGRTGEDVYLVLGAVVIFLNLYHQLNGQIMSGALQQARNKIALSSGDTPNRDAFANLGAKARQRLDRFLRLRRYLAEHRIRADVFSAIEFQMAIFIIAPLTGQVVAVTAGACALLLIFEFASVVKFALAAKALQRKLRATGILAPSTVAPPAVIPRPAGPEHLATHSQYPDVHSR